MNYNQEVKALIIDKASNFFLPENDKKEIVEKREYFLKTYSKERILNLDKEHYFQGKGIKNGNFTYDLEWYSKCLGSIRGGSKYKFGYEEDFDKIKKLLIKLINAENTEDQFYLKNGKLSDYSFGIIKDAESLKGISRTLIGKTLSIYHSSVFINIFADQRYFLTKIIKDYVDEYHSVESFFRNNYLLLKIKEELTPSLDNNTFSTLLYALYPPRKTSEDIYENSPEIKALEPQHYQTLVDRNFRVLFKGELEYHNKKTQEDNYGHFDTEEVGTMDFLAVDKQNNFVVIELKRNSDDKAIGQILRYIGWVKERLCKKGQTVRGIILAETKDTKLDYALKATPNVQFKKMKLNVSIED